MKMTIGSTSECKYRALKEALETVFGLNAIIPITRLKTSSGQHEQPVGFSETYGGAYARAKAGQIHDPSSFAVGIESGIFRFGTNGHTVTTDAAIIVILNPDGRRILTTSAGIVFPEEYVVKAAHLGFATTTVGSVIAKELGGDPTDPHLTLTKGRTSRNNLIYKALVTALLEL